MIINGERVQGIYLYNTDSQSVEFTKGDLVVSGDSIYVCDAETAQGINPKDDTSYEYYRPYPGSKIITASEFLQYAKDGGTGEVGNKYVSAQAILGILQSYQFGLDMEGVISDWIDKNGDTTLMLSSPTEKPLDNLMLTETLNRGMIKVSHELSQIVDGEVSGVKFSTIFGFLEKEGIDYQLLLSQYTYKSSDDQFMRVQEMTSPLTGVSVYRYMSWKDGNFPSDGNVISGWRNVFSYSSAIKNRLDTLLEFSKEISNQWKTRVEALEGSFRFEEIYDGGDSDTVTGLDIDGIYTVCVRKKFTEGEGLLTSDIWKTDSVTVILDSRYRVELTNLEGSYIDITPVSIKVSSGVEIISIYKRKEFRS